eukprot:8716555-Lingulodinium_polyedra.AAC.1
MALATEPTPQFPGKQRIGGASTETAGARPHIGVYGVNLHVNPWVKIGLTGLRLLLLIPQTPAEARWARPPDRPIPTTARRLLTTNCLLLTGCL